LACPAAEWRELGSDGVGPEQAIYYIKLRDCVNYAPSMQRRIRQTPGTKEARAKVIRGIADIGKEGVYERGSAMTSSIQQTSPVAANTDPAATTSATAATATTKSKNPVQAAVPQDTVTISAQASAIANSAATQTSSAKATPLVAATANTNAAPAANANPTAVPVAAATSNATPPAVANAIALATATSSMLALEQQVQQLSFQGLSASEIAANLNIPVGEVQLYLTGTQAASAAQTAPAPQTAGINNSASAATTPTAPKIQLYWKLCKQGRFTLPFGSGEQRRPGTAPALQSGVAQPEGIHNNRY
jgi:hypothetical protein